MQSGESIKVFETGVPLQHILLSLKIPFREYVVLISKL